MNNVLARFAPLSAAILAIGLMIGGVKGDTVVQVNLNGGVYGIFGDFMTSYQVQLYDSVTPITVNNFMQYVNNAKYSNTIIHRNVPGFIIQGGGFEIERNAQQVITGLNLISNYGTIQNEPYLSNIRGTIAMAKVGGDPNSATSQWFVNLSDNSQNLDNQNGGFTAFGYVAGEGMTLVDAISNITPQNVNNLYDPNYNPQYPDAGPFAEVPLITYPNGSIGFVTVMSVTKVNTIEWKGGGASTDWGLAANWVTGAAPNGAGVNLSIGSQVAANNIIDLGSADRTVGNIYYTIPTNTAIQSSGNKSLILDNPGSYSLVNVLGDHSIDVPLILHNNVLFNAHGTLAVSGNISGNFSLALGDGGILTLTGNNTYGGNTLITSGTLMAGKPASLPGYNVAGKVTVSTDSMLAVMAGAAPGAWTSTDIDTLRSKVAFDNGAWLGIDTSSGPFTYESLVDGNIGLTKLGSNTLTLTNTNTYTGSTNFGGGLIKAQGLNNLGNGTVINFNGGGLLFDGVYDPSERTMNFLQGGATLDTPIDITLANSIGNYGAGGLTKQGVGTLTLLNYNPFLGPLNFNAGMIKAASIYNLGYLDPQNGYVSDLIFNGGGLIFDGVYDPSERIMAIMAGGAMLDTQGNDITLASSLGDDSQGNDGDGGLTKKGTGTLTLLSPARYKGATVINGGTLKLGSGVTLLSSSSVNLNANNTKLDIGGTSQIIASLAGVIDSEVKLGGSTLTIGGDNTSTLFAGAITSTTGGSLIKIGSGIFTITGNNNYLGNTSINVGTLVAGKAASLPGYNVKNKVTVNAGATLGVRAGAATGEWIAAEIDALRTNVLFNEGSFLAFDTSSNNFSYANAIDGKLGITKLGANMLTLGGTNTFTGPVNFNGGFINAAALNKLGNGTVLNFNGGGLQFNGVFDPSVRAMNFLGDVTFDTLGLDIAFANPIGNGGSGGLTKIGVGTLTLNGVNTYNGNTIINQGTLEAGKAASLPGYNAPYKVVVNSNTTLAVRAGATGEWTDMQIDDLRNNATFVDRFAFLGIDTTGGDFPYGSVIDGEMGLTKLGSNTLTLTGANTFTGAINFNGGLIKAVAPGNLITGTGAFNFNGGGLQFNGIFDPSVHQMNFQAGGATFDTQLYNITFNGAIGNGGDGGLTKKGLGTLTLKGNNIFKGAINFNGGLIKAGLNSLGNNSPLNFNGGGLQFDGSYDPSTHTMSFLSGGAILDTQTNAITLASAIGNGGAGGLTKSGSGTLTLAAANTFTGAVNFNGGLINAAALNNLGGGSALNFNGGGLQFGGGFDPSVRTMTFQLGGATLDTQANIIILNNAIGNNGSGGLTKNGSGTLEFKNAISYSGDTVINQGVFKINNNLSTTLNDISGNGTLLVEGASTVLNITSLAINTLTIGAGSKVVLKPLPGGPLSQSLDLTPVPEPNTLLLLGIAALSACFIAYRRK